MKKSYPRFVIIALMTLVSQCLMADEPQWSQYVYFGQPPSAVRAESRPWMLTLQYGPSLAFGDDSYQVFRDFKNACGNAFSLSVGKSLTRIIDAQLKLRIMKLYSRTNLEFLESNVEDHPDMFPRDGFYGYTGMALQAEARFNMTELAFPHRQNKFFNFYLIAGAGYNSMEGYDHRVDNWMQNIWLNGSYIVDTETHYMPVGVVGAAFDFKINRYVSLNIEALGSITGDKMEGVVYEEPYDVYVTASGGITLYF